jgi:hypothetical protein
MNRIKAFLLICAIVAVSFFMVGCGLAGTWRASSTVDVNVGDDVPEWLTLAHRAQAAEEPVVEPEDDDSNQGPATTPSANQPPSTQPGTTQPAQQTEQPAPESGTPKWQQPGTMEYIAKQRLDQLVFNYKRLNSEIVELEAIKNKNDDQIADLKSKKIDREIFYKDTLAEIAAGLGLSLEKEYGIKPPLAATTETTDSTWFQNWDESPSGFNQP